MLKVSCSAQQRGELRHLAQIFRADILDVSSTSVVVEIVGKEDKLKALTDLLEPYGEVSVKHEAIFKQMCSGSNIRMNSKIPLSNFPFCMILRYLRVTFPYWATGILEVARTGRIALLRESGLDNRFLERTVTRRVY